MIPIDQSILHDPDNGKNGDCWRACIASVLELPIKDVPHFVDFADSRDSVRSLIRLLFKHRYIIYHVVQKEHPKMLEDEHEYYFATGPGPRGFTHMVVCHNGEIIHDPHPDKTGLEKIDYFEIMLKI